MNKYIIYFTLADFDQVNEQHRLTETAMDIVSIAHHLIYFAARLLHCPPEDLPARRVLIRSARMIQGRKVVPLTPDEVKEAMLRVGLNARGRGEQRKNKPYHPFNPHTVHKRVEQQRRR